MTWSDNLGTETVTLAAGTVLGYVIQRRLQQTELSHAATLAREAREEAERAEDRTKEVLKSAAAERAKQEERRLQERREERLIGALDFFTHGSQRRNVGISVVEGAWASIPELRSTLIPLLVNQSIYLLTGSGQGEAEHEIDNLSRMMALVLAPANKEAAQRYYPDLRAAVDKAMQPDRPADKGLHVEPAKLASWLAALDAGNAQAVGHATPCPGSSAPDAAIAR